MPKKLVELRTEDYEHPIDREALAKVNAIDMDTYPDLYTHQEYEINAYTTGDRQDAFMVLSSGAFDKLTDSEMSFVIGHESGHIKSRHVLNHVLCAYINQIP